MNYNAQLAKSARKWANHYRKASRGDICMAALSIAVALANGAYAVASGHWLHALVAVAFAGAALVAFKTAKVDVDTASKWDEAAATYDRIAGRD